MCSIIWISISYIDTILIYIYIHTYIYTHVYIYIYTGHFQQPCTFWCTGKVPAPRLALDSRRAISGLEIWHGVASGKLT